MEHSIVHALADVIQRTYKDCKKQTCRRELSFYLLKTRTICDIFIILRNELMVLIFYCKRYVRKGNNAKNSAIHTFSSLPKELS